MIRFKAALIRTQEVEAFICDKCGKEIKVDDLIEIQESYSIRFVGGYGSVFGDGAVVSCDLCQNCLKALIGEFCRYPREAHWTEA